MAGESGQNIIRYPPFTNEPELPASSVPGVIDVSALRALDGALGRAGLNPTVLRFSVRAAAVSLTVSIAVDVLEYHQANLFSWHPVFITLGFVGLMSEGILLGSAFRALDGRERVAAIIRHALMQVGACIAIAIGFWAIYWNKVVNKKRPNLIDQLKSWHSWLGIVAIAGAGAVVMGGVVSFRRIGILAKLPAHVQPLVKAAHRYAGAAVWLLAMVTMLLGLQTHGAGPRVVLHYIDALGICVMTTAQVLLLLSTSHTAAVSLPDAVAVARESEVLLAERRRGGPIDASTRMESVVMETDITISEQ